MGWYPVAVVMSDKKNVIRELYQITKNSLHFLQGLHMNFWRLFTVISIKFSRLQVMQSQFGSCIQG
jgi:hypothetical protein